VTGRTAAGAPIFADYRPLPSWLKPSGPSAQRDSEEGFSPLDVVRIFPLIVAELARTTGIVWGSPDVQSWPWSAVRVHVDDILSRPGPVMTQLVKGATP
jgi:hypothetical protein